MITCEEVICRQTILTRVVNHEMSNGSEILNIYRSMTYSTTPPFIQEPVQPPPPLYRVDKIENYMKKTTTTISRKNNSITKPL